MRRLKIDSSGAICNRHKIQKHHKDFRNKRDIRNLTRLLVGISNIPKACILCGGTTTENWRNKLLAQFDRYRKIATRALGTSYMINHRDRDFLIIFNIFGPSASYSCTKVLLSNGAKNLFFIGWAGAFGESKIGDIILPRNVIPFDGITTLINPRLNTVSPNGRLYRVVQDKFQQSGIEYKQGTTICIPAVDLFEKYRQRACKRKTIAVEMELSPILFLSKRKAQAVAALVVSDTPGKTPYTKLREKMRIAAMKKVIRIAVETFS